MVFTWRMVPEVVQPFWAALQRGEFVTGAAEGVGTYRKKGARWMVAEGGVPPRRGRDLAGRCLCHLHDQEVRRHQRPGGPGRLSRRVLQALDAEAHGRFRTSGRYSAATGRGAAWTVTDRCDGTLTSVQTHSVTVTNSVRHTTITVRAHHSYLAKPESGKRHK